MTTRHYQLAAGNERARLQASTRSLSALAPTQIQIRVGAASLNYRDLLVRQMQGDNRANLTPLSDAAGTVVAVGSAVTRWREGDRVSPGFFAAWINGAFKSHHMPSALGGGQTDGVLAEYIVAEETAVVAVPQHVSLAEAASLPCAGVTAWHALFERGHLQEGDTVLVQGTGGVAMIALQLASAHGAKVILCSHLGRPKGVRSKKESLRPVADHLHTLLNHPVAFSHDSTGEVPAKLLEEMGLSNGNGEASSNGEKHSKPSAEEAAEIETDLTVE